MLALPRELTAEQARATASELVLAIQALPSGSPAALDGGALEHFDSTALVVMVECQRAARRGARGFELSNIPPRLSQLAALYGVAELLGLPAVPAA
jgi:phospholipid transport system transporter-binding protein